MDSMFLTMLLLGSFLLLNGMLMSVYLYKAGSVAPLPVSSSLHSLSQPTFMIKW